jgi:hypothetical protein
VLSRNGKNPNNEGNYCNSQLGDYALMSMDFPFEQKYIWSSEKFLNTPQFGHRQPLVATFSLALPLAQKTFPVRFDFL